MTTEESSKHPQMITNENRSVMTTGYLHRHIDPLPLRVYRGSIQHEGLLKVLAVGSVSSNDDNQFPHRDRHRILDRYGERRAATERLRWRIKFFHTVQPQCRKFFDLSAIQILFEIIFW